MEVQNCTKQVHLDSEEDDDGPTIFKRSTPSKQNQLSSFRKLPSQNNVGSATKHTSSSLHASKDKTIGLQKDKTSSSKISIERPKTVSSNASASVHDNDKGFTSQSLASSLKMKASPSSKSSVATENSINSDVKKPLSVRLGASSTGSNSTVDQKPPKQILATNNASGHMTADRPSGKAASPDDSDDDANVPLSAKFSSASLAPQRGNSFVNSRPGASSTGNKSAAHQNALKQSTASGLTNNSCGQLTTDKLNEQTRSPDDSDSIDDDNVPLSTKFSSASLAFHRGNPLPTMKASIKEASDDSEDEKPLLYRLQTKIVGTTVKSNPNKNPSSSKIMANGYAKKESIDGLHPKGSSKRSIDDTCNSGETFIKKAKVLGNSAPIKLKQEVVVKKEQEIDDDHIPIAQRMKKPVSPVNQVSMKKEIKKSVSSVNQVSMKKDIKKTTLFKKDGKKMKSSRDSIYSKSSKVPPGSGGGEKWTTLVHNGVIFPPQYTPHGIKMLYNGQPVDLTPEQEEVATMFAVMKETDYATKPKFIENFMNDWRPILGKNHVIKKFDLCDFTPIYEWHLREKEKKKQFTSEEKKKIKEDKMKQEDKYMWAIVDGVKEKVGNFRVEPPGLFRGRGEHPKMGKLKRRIRPRDITINIGKGAPIPECPIPGERWKEVKHDNTVTWLAYWSDPINSKEYKYVFLAASSSLKGQSDKEKYEKARMLKNSIQNIRANYTKDFNSKDATKRQIAVATYLIDKLALRAGNEKDDDEADTVGCCTLKVENVKLLPPNKLQFDFLGKDSIRYFNTVEVELAVYKAIGEFQSARKNDGRKKTEGDDLFDLLDTSKLNAHLKELMPGLTAKVFRTYNASITLDVMLHKETKGGTVLEKVAVYQMANKEAAIICNHQRSVSKSHDAQISKLDEKINELKAQRKELEVDLSKAKRGKPLGKDSDGKLKKNLSPELLEKKMAQFDLKIEKMESSRNLKEDMKTVALGTSKINYLDPRITVAWCKRSEVPIEKVFNKSLLAKFAWAMDVDPDFRF